MIYDNQAGSYNVKTVHFTKNFQLKISHSMTFFDYLKLQCNLLSSKCLKTQSNLNTIKELTTAERNNWNRKILRARRTRIACFCFISQNCKICFICTFNVFVISQVIGYIIQIQSILYRYLFTAVTLIFSTLALPLKSGEPFLPWEVIEKK